MTNRLAFVLFLLLAVPGALFAGEAADPAPADAAKSLSVKTFQFKHKAADKATAVIKSLMSSEGSISIQPSTNAVVVTDRPENMKAIAAALEKFDTPAQAFKLSVRVFAASRAEGTGRTPDELRDVAPTLAMLRYNSFESLGSAVVDGHEGESGIVDLNTGYRADFRFGDYDPATDSVQVSDFKVSRLQGDQLTPLLKKTTMNLKLGQVVVLGAASKPQDARALMIIIAAKR